MITTKVIVPQGLNNLRDEEERQANRVLFQNSMRVLQDKRIVTVSPFKERDSGDRRN